jgi:hypothetical protein
MPGGWKDEVAIVEPDNVWQRDTISDTREGGSLVFCCFISTVGLIQQDWLHCKGTNQTVAEPLHELTNYVYYHANFFLVLLFLI